MSKFNPELMYKWALKEAKRRNFDYETMFDFASWCVLRGLEGKKIYRDFAVAEYFNQKHKRNWANVCLEPLEVKNKWLLPEDQGLCQPNNDSFSLLLRKLKGEDRMIGFLHFKWGMRIREIAEVCDLKERDLKVRLKRIAIHVMGLLKEEELCASLH